ncbi:hypothetical protein C0W35_21995 [Photobacterium kishitanii]|nr:hypothetical protein C0W35_21995 [Photobacterium kishitanii]
MFFSKIFHVKYNGKPIVAYHNYNAATYPHLTDERTNIYSATKYEHLYRWHGGNFQNTTS